MLDAVFGNMAATLLAALFNSLPCAQSRPMPRPVSKPTPVGDGPQGEIIDVEYREVEE